MTFPRYLKITILLFGFLMLCTILSLGKSIIIPFYIGVLFTLLLMPLCNFFERKGLSRKLSAVSCILLVIIFFAGFIYFIGSRITSLSGDLSQLEQELLIYKDDIETFLQKNFNLSEEEQQVQVNSFKQTVINQLLGVRSWVSAFAVMSVVFPMTMYFFMSYRSHYKNFLFKIFKPQHYNTITEIYRQEVKITSRYLLGLMGVVAILAVCNVTALSIIGIKYALLFGVIAAFLNIIPIIGSLIGSVLPVLYALLSTESMIYPLIVGGYFLVIQLLESSIITPNIVGSPTKVNPFFLLLGIFTGSIIWGAAGMVLFIPLIVQLKILFSNIEPLKPYGFLITAPEKAQSIKKNKKYPAT